MHTIKDIFFTYGTRFRSSNSLSYLIISTSLRSVAMDITFHSFVSVRVQHLHILGTLELLFTFDGSRTFLAFFGSSWTNGRDRLLAGMTWHNGLLGLTLP